jgi:tRNA pseudouridine55 synthase
MNAVIIIDKPAGLTSHDVVNRMRRILGQRSIGHLGTLDPLATGVLPLVTGSFTRLAKFYISSEKTYEGVIRFGFATNTYDADGEPLHEPRNVQLSLPQLQNLAAEFVGVLQQVPPPFSAKKINGVPAYKLARKQQQVVLAPVAVEIKEFLITALNNDRANFRARVSSGTYMRSIAHEMGQRLGCGAHLETLRRTSVAEFDITQAHTVDEIETRLKIKVSDSEACGKNGVEKTIPHSEPGSSPGVEREFCDSEPLGKPGVEKIVCHSEPGAKPGFEREFCHSEPGGKPGEEPAFPCEEDKSALFIHPRQLLPHFPAVTADEATAARIRSGQSVNLPDVSRARQVKVFASQTDLISIATRIAGTLFHAKIVFPAS